MTPAFFAAACWVLRHEGLGSDDPADPGGPTRFGVAQRHHPGLDVRRLTLDAALDVYWRDYWRVLDLDRFPASVGAKLLDMAVQFGPGTAARLLQQALVTLGHVLAVDGVLGTGTLAAARAVPSDVLIAALCGHMYVAYAARPQPRFMHGWVRRAAERPDA